MYKLVFSSLAVSLIITASGCNTNRTLDAAEILNKSIAYHDPNNEWNRFKGTFYFESTFSWNDSIPEELIVTIDVADNYVKYVNLDRGTDLVFLKDSCKVIKGDGDCDSYEWIRNFYTYVWGLPMKLRDPGTDLNPEYTVEEFNSTSCYVLNVKYERENWHYYFDKNDFRLVGFTFVFNDKPEKGEKIYLSGEYQVGKMRLPALREWTDYFDGSVLGTNELVRFKDS